MAFTRKVAYATAKPVTAKPEIWCGSIRRPAPEHCCESLQNTLRARNGAQSKHCKYPPVTLRILLKYAISKKMRWVPLSSREHAMGTSKCSCGFYFSVCSLRVTAGMEYKDEGVRFRKSRAVLGSDSEGSEPESDAASSTNEVETLRFWNYLWSELLRSFVSSLEAPASNVLCCFTVICLFFQALKAPFLCFLHNALSPSCSLSICLPPYLSSLKFFPKCPLVAWLQVRLILSFQSDGFVSYLRVSIFCLSDAFFLETLAKTHDAHQSAGACRHLLNDGRLLISKDCLILPWFWNFLGLWQTSVGS